MYKIKDILDYLTCLSRNNNKAWFEEHKAEYKEFKMQWDAFALEFMHAVEDFDSRVHDLQVRDITYRIYRDIRFSQDKRPYKDWFGVYVCPRGKKSGMAGYYIHFEPANDTYFVCGGLYNPDKDVLNSVREGIMLEPDEFHDAVMACGEDFKLNWESALKRMPKGWNENDKHSEYYRLRSFEVYKSYTKSDVLKKGFLNDAVAALKRTHKFNELLNKCYDYAKSED